MSKAARLQRRELRRAERAERYWFITRWFDGRWGKRDGKADLLSAAVEDYTRTGQPADPARDGDPMGLTPHLGTIDNHYRGKVAGVRERTERLIADAVREKQSVDVQISVAANKVAAANAAVDAHKPLTTQELEQRNAVEKHQAIETIRTRHQRPWDAQHAQLLARAEAAAAELENLKVRWAELDGQIRALRSLAGRRARKLQEHALRRQRTYERRLVLRHAEGSRLVTLLQIHRPKLPDWVEEYSAEGSIRPWHDDVPATKEHTRTTSSLQVLGSDASKA